MTAMHPHVATCASPGCLICDTPEGLSYDAAEQAADYEHSAELQTADSELFDDTGTPPGFCPDCEHAPCVAGYVGRCCCRPRSIVARAVRDEALDLVDRVRGTGRSDKARTHDAEICSALRLAVFSIGDSAVFAPDWYGAEALKDLARLRTKLRTLVAS